MVANYVLDRLANIGKCTLSTFLPYLLVSDQFQLLFKLTSTSDLQPSTAIANQLPGQ